MNSALVNARARLKRWKENPVAFVYENFKVEPDAWQQEVLSVFPSPDANKKRISMQACAGPGKSAVLSWLGWNFLACYGEEHNHPKGAAIAVTKDNLRDNLWPEFANWQSRSEFLKEAFTWQKERIFATDHPETWFLSARAFAKKANPEEQARSLSGLHAKFVLVLIDEAGDIPVPVLRAGEQALGNTAFGKLCQAGNPTSLEGCLYHAAVPARHLWWVIAITADPDDPKRTPRVDKEWATEQIRLYGRDNPWVKSFILGQFPPQSINALLGIEDVEAAMNRFVQPDEYTWAQKRLGVDVARFGDDRTTICPRQGLVWFKPAEPLRQARSTQIAARVAMAAQKWGDNPLILCDGTGGWAHGTIDQLIVAGFSPIDIQYHGKAPEAQYANMRAYMWMKGSEHIKRGAVLPYVPELIAELTTPTYTFHNGQFLIEPKDLVKKRLGRSPDLADGYFNTYALPDMPRDLSMLDTLGMGHQRNHARTDFDPQAELDRAGARAETEFEPYA